MFLFNCILYQTKLIPRWLSVSGLIGSALSISASLLFMIRFIGLDATYMMLNIPIAFQQLVLAIWLIIKGFNRAEQDSLSNWDECSRKEGETEMNKSERFWDKTASKYDQLEMKDEQTYIHIIKKTKPHRPFLMKGIRKAHLMSSWPFMFCICWKMNLSFYEEWMNCWNRGDYWFLLRKKIFQLSNRNAWRKVLRNISLLLGK